ncbi:E3 ubiquitin-protein ligase RNF180 isoform X2 [Betta splendens]|uniref:E3 ubiquitin-protein ligase RNF180 isoform X2 n=1 Tax=Betta splendens TaxID=158456 RepID=A0A9W2Y6B5_BETSP|nr:E3 ubiquitin-protein ligase RNF180 isoform X2 [Betta splendens]
MLRCRRCRKLVIDSTCLEMVDETISSAAVCNIWHVNADLLPDWILTSVHQAQWTVGKLNCQNCSARLGGFNFLSNSQCPCGRYNTVHLNKSRVDCDQRKHVLIVQPRRMRPGRAGQACLLSDPLQNSEESPAPNRSPFNCMAVMSDVFTAEATDTLTDSEDTLPFSPLYCISNRRRCSMEDDAAFRLSCFCPAGLMDGSALNLSNAGVDEDTQLPASSPASQPFDTGAEASFSAIACHTSGFRERQSEQALLQNPTNDASPGREDVSDSDMLIRGRTVSDDEAEQEEVVLSQASSVSNRLSKREKNRLKSVRRKQRRRELWLKSQLEEEQAGSVSRAPLDGEEDREGVTCAVCLDIYFSPHSCHPCGHIFCEPCLRTLARSRTANTPCPLCRTLISHTNIHKELDQNVKAMFPKVHSTRKQNFHNAPCAKWPLPSVQKGFRTFWGYQRQTMMARRRWHFANAGFALHTLDFTGMQGWLFNIGLVIIYIRSVNWILVFLLFCFLLYYFFF